MENVIATNTIKGGGQTVFLDLKQAKNDTVYLTLTTLGRNQAGQDERRSVTLWQSQIGALQQSLKEIIGNRKLGDAKPSK